MEPEDVVHVLRNVDQALKPRGLLFDIHPTADDPPIRSSGRGLGFVDARRFEPVVATTNAAVDALVGDGSFEDVRRVEREIEELYADAEDLLDTADEWTGRDESTHPRRGAAAAAVVAGGLPATQEASGSTSSPILTRPGSTTAP